MSWKTALLDDDSYFVSWEWPAVELSLEVFTQRIVIALAEGQAAPVYEVVDKQQARRLNT